MHPVHQIVETYINGSSKDAGKMKTVGRFTVSRIVTIAFNVGIVIICGNNMTQFLSVMAALSATPICFLFPVWIHYTLFYNQMSTC